MTATTEPAVLFVADTGISSNPLTHAHRKPPGIEIIHSHAYDGDHWHRLPDHAEMPGRNPNPWPAKPEPLDKPRAAQRLFGGIIRDRMQAGGHPFP